MRTAKRYGTIGAICIPIILGALVLIRGTLPYDSFMYSALQKVFYIPTIPLFWLMERIMEGCGIHGEEGMHYLLPMFLSMLIYWALIGFAIGFLTGRTKEMIRRQ